MCCQKKRYNSVFSERGRLEQSPVITPLWGCERNLGGTFGLAPPVYRRGNGLNSTNFSRAEPTHTSDLSTGNPDKDGGRASSKWLERGGQGSEWSQESLASAASFLRHVPAGACACQAQRGVLELQRGHPPLGYRQGERRQWPLSAMGGCTWCYQLAYGRGSPGGERQSRAGEATRPGIRQEERDLSVKRCFGWCVLNQPAREDVKGTVRGKGGRRTGSSDRDQTLRIPVKPC